MGFAHYCSGRCVASFYGILGLLHRKEMSTHMIKKQQKTFVKVSLYIQLEALPVLRVGINLLSEKHCASW